MNDDDKKWNSIRNIWPENPGKYEVQDCQQDVKGTSYYDGYDFQNTQFKVIPKGGLLLVMYKITHWRNIYKDN